MLGPTSLLIDGWKAVAGGLAQVLLVTLDGLLDAQQHGGEPLVQP